MTPDARDTPDDAPSAAPADAPAADDAPADDDAPAAAPPPRSASHRNYVLGAMNGLVGGAAYDCIHPELILSGFLYAVTAPVYGDGAAVTLVAVLAVLNKAGSLLPQLGVSSLLEHQALRRPFYARLGAVRMLGGGGMLVAMAWMAWQVDLWSVGLFLAAFSVVSVCMGSGYVVVMDMFGRMIRIERIGTFLGTREFLSGAASLVVGLVVVQPLLNRGGSGAGTPTVAMNFFWVTAVGTVLTAASFVFLLACREQPGPRAKRRTTLAESLIRGRRWLKRNPDYRAYLWLRIAFRVNILGLAFIIPFGEQKLAGVALLGGVLVATLKVSRLISSGLWGWMVDAHGDRACLIGGGLCFIAGPLLTILAPVLPEGFLWIVPWVDVSVNLPLLVYLVALGVMGAGLQASMLGGNRFLIGRAPPRRRLSYIAFLNTVTSPLTLLPLGAAALVKAAGMTALFGVIAAGGLLWLYWAIRLRPEADMPPLRNAECASAECGMNGPR
jgi:hypothetical protein